MDDYLAETPETSLSHCSWGQAQLQQPLPSPHQHGARGRLVKHKVLLALQLDKGACLPWPLHILLMYKKWLSAGKGEVLSPPFCNCKVGRDLNPLTQPSVFHVLDCFSGLFPLPDASTYLVSHMESIRRGNSLLQALVCCCFEPSQTTSLTLRTKACSLPQKQAVTGPGTQPRFAAPQPGMEASSAARPVGAAGGKGRQAAAR